MFPGKIKPPPPPPGPPAPPASPPGGGATAGALCLAACGGTSESTPSELTLDDVPVGEAVAAKTVSGEDALLYRVGESELVAFTAVCTHYNGKVSPEGTQLRCPLHNSVFDAATGEPLSGPATKPLTRLDVTTEGNEITIG
ncbi:Rieske (2Fe-2S) protein [Streptomyces sp. NPDC059853]|uniref:Rieske (2Fe-2S) protein n=1 Tax=Streptomyces sp. NPDC059853 TaxID=3346973 RepID=UPI003657BEAC